MNIGTGSHTYEWIGGWGALPEGKQYGYTHAVVEDAAGRIYVHNAGADSVCVFDAEGKFLNSWGEQWAEGAHGLTLSKEGDAEYLYLATTKQATVVKTTLDGKVLWENGAPDLPDIYNEEKKYSPTETAVGPNGEVYVADGYGQPYIHRYSLDGEYKGTFGEPGDGKGQLSNPHGISIDTRGSEPLVLVSDRGNARLQYFSLEGEHVRFSGIDIVLKPCTTVPFGDEIYIPDLYSRMTILDKDDKLIGHLGEREKGWEIEGWPNIDHGLRQDGNFTSPHGLHVDGAGNVYMAEWINDGRVTKLRKV